MVEMGGKTLQLVLILKSSSPKMRGNIKWKHTSWFSERGI